MCVNTCVGFFFILIWLWTIAGLSLFVLKKDVWKMEIHTCKFDQIDVRNIRTSLYKCMAFSKYNDGSL